MNEKLELISKGLRELEAGPPKPARPFVIPASQMGDFAKASRSHLAKVEELTRSFEIDLIDIKHRELKAEKEAEVIAKTRAEYVGKLKPHVEQIRNLGTMARAQRPRFTREAALQRATFRDDPVEDATIRTATMMRLAKMSPTALKAFAVQAAATGDAASAGALAEELHDRLRHGEKDVHAVDRATRAEIGALLAHVPSEAEEAAPHLDAIEAVELRLPIATGEGRPVDRIRAGLAEQGVVRGNVISGNTPS